MKIKKINKPTTNKKKVWCIYTDTDSIHETSLISTEEFGDIPVKVLYDRLAARESSETLTNEGREFVFPKEVNALYARDENRAEMGMIDYIERHRVAKKMYRITTDNGKEVIVTEDHSVMVLDSRGKLIERKPTEINPGDKVVTVKR